MTIRTPQLGTILGGAALAVALANSGGVAEAAKLINGKLIKAGTVSTKQIKDHSITGADLAPGVVTVGPAGPQGDRGPQGPAGPSIDPIVNGPDFEALPGTISTMHLAAGTYLLQVAGTVRTVDPNFNLHVACSTVVPPGATTDGKLSDELHGKAQIGGAGSQAYDDVYAVQDMALLGSITLPEAGDVSVFCEPLLGAQGQRVEGVTMAVQKFRATN